MRLVFRVGVYLNPEPWNSGTPEPTAFDSCRFPLRNLGWWAGVSYTTGALMYNVGSTSFLANTFYSVNFSADMVVGPGSRAEVLRFDFRV